ncbi:transglutaminase-like cysteine peptidase [Devosia geojensis]|uniref:transglutaminase-like cysteine peptidase n=1 Tax=Devosia geojensis TaxID=443610 RepID=UPI000697C1A7|nr:transglutaminase-like cysteine peptidase [Devosia geojensis]
MSTTFKGLKSFIVVALAALCAAPAAALDLTNVAFVQTATGNTSIPVGHAEFCNSRPAECQANANPVLAVTLDDARWSQLLEINAYYNDTIVAVSDNDLYGVEEFWTYPNGYGDCEDFVLAKRRALIEAGWPASALLMSVVREPNGDGHAVLIVRTDRGDLVLDNQDGLIRVWNETPYQFVKRQDQAHAGRWVDMIDNRTMAVATTASH